MSMLPDDPRHGTANGYTNLGCRCDDCKSAHADYCREYRHRSGRSVPIEQWLSEVRQVAEARDNHGTESRYRFGCRCDLCKKAVNAARADRRKRPNVAVHGTHSGYSNGCRCDSCRAADTAYSRARRQLKRAAA